MGNCSICFIVFCLCFSVSSIYLLKSLPKASRPHNLPGKKQVSSNIRLMLTDPTCLFGPITFISRHILLDFFTTSCIWSSKFPSVFRVVPKFYIFTVLQMLFYYLFFFCSCFHCHYSRFFFIPHSCLFYSPSSPGFIIFFLHVLSLLFQLFSP